MPRTSVSGPRPAYRIDAIERGLRVLRLFSRERHSLSLTEISDGIDCVASTSLRLVKTLCDLDFLQEVPGTGHYRPGLAAIRTGTASLMNSSLHFIATPVLSSLHNTFGETVYLDVLMDGQICHVECFKKKENLVTTASEIGALTATTTTSSGKLFLAFLEEEERALILNNQTVRSSPDTAGSSVAAMARELEKIRAEGIAFADYERSSNSRSVSAPIKEGDAIVAAVTVAGNADLITIGDIRSTIANAAKSAAEEITTKFRQAKLGS